MIDRNPDSATTPARIRAALRELVRAIDRRTPHLERAGETRIAGDAQVLRREAVRRIGELTRAESSHTARDQELAEAVMTDDGGALSGFAHG